MSRAGVALTGVVVTALLVSGCGQSGLYGAPLPGGADLGEHPYRVTAEFADVLDLVPRASVRQGDVPVGRVERITLAPDGSAALVELAINGNIALPANARAELRTASLLGEKFVQLSAPVTGPDGPPRGVLRDGAVLPLTYTRRYPEVEEVLGALSLLLNGGGLAQLRDIVREVNAATSGNEPQIRSLLSRLEQVTGQLDTQRATIVRAIDGLGRLSASLSGQSANIATALDQLGPGIAVIEQQRTQLVDMLRALDRLSGVAVDTVNRGRDDLLADLRALTPTLRQLAEAGDNIPNSLQILLTYPFPDYALKSLKGDFFNMDLQVDFDLNATMGNLMRSSQPIVPIPGSSGAPLPIPALTQPPVAPKAGDGLAGLLLPLTGEPR